MKIVASQPQGRGQGHGWYVFLLPIAGGSFAAKGFSGRKRKFQSSFWCFLGSVFLTMQPRFGLRALAKDFAPFGVGKTVVLGGAVSVWLLRAACRQSLPPLQQKGSCIPSASCFPL